MADYFYYPNEEYLRRNWAPEKIPEESLRALAQAQKKAVGAKVLSPFLADKFLPNALVEGRSGLPGYEVDDVTRNLQYDPHMGASFGVRTDTRSPMMEQLINQMGGMPKYANQEEEYFDPKGPALRAAAALAEKAKIYGDEMAIERWSGIGSLAKHHVRKVDDMMKMLKHEKNSAIREAYQKMLNE